jgi:hypothetical protein
MAALVIVTHLQHKKQGSIRTPETRPPGSSIRSIETGAAFD